MAIRQKKNGARVKDTAVESRQNLIAFICPQATISSTGCAFFCVLFLEIKDHKPQEWQVITFAQTLGDGVESCRQG